MLFFAAFFEKPFRITNLDQGIVIGTSESSDNRLNFFHVTERKVMLFSRLSIHVLPLIAYSSTANAIWLLNSP